MNIDKKIKKTGIIIFCILLPVFAWIYEYQQNNLVFNLSYFINLHNEHPALIILDLIPFSFAGIFYFIISKYHRNETKNQSTLNFQNKIINQNADYAKKIGNGEYNFHIPIENTSDILANNLAIMRRNLLSKQNIEHDLAWISKGKEMISEILRNHQNINDLTYDVLVNIIKYTNLIQGAVYLYDDEKRLLVNNATYAFNRKKYREESYKIGEGLIGQAAYEMASIYRKEIPDNFISISSGILGEKKPGSFLIVPLKNENILYGIIELVSLEDNIPKKIMDLVEEMSEIIARTIFNLKINIKTQNLLSEAQVMTKELRENEERLHLNAVEMEITQEKIEEANENLELQIKLVENSKQRLHSLLENASEVISIYHPDGTVFYESPSIKNILGYKPDEVIGTDGFLRILETQYDSAHLVFSHLLKNPDQHQVFEFQYKKKDGTLVWLEAVGRNFLSNPAIHGIIFNTRDISERRRAEKEQRKRGQMQSLSENSPDMIIRLAPDGTFYYVNPIVEKYTFIPPSKFFQKNLNEMALDSEMKSLLNDVVNKVKAKNQKQKMEFELESVFEKKQLLVNAIPENNEEKELESILLIVHDNTEQKKNENEIREKNKNITESINYAKRIQTSIIPTINHITKHLEKSFIFYKPRDVVSGDFPWFFRKGDNIYIAAVDCTGHGVPGALLTFIGYFLLNSIVDHSHDYDAGEVLTLLHSGVKLTLKQDAENTGANDGMDIALCKINTKTNNLQFAGAHRPLYLVRKLEVDPSTSLRVTVKEVESETIRTHELIEYKGDRKAIGGSFINKKCTENYTTHQIQLNPKDKIFFYTDGLSDQFNEKSKKYSSLKIKNDIEKNADLSMSEFADFFASEFKLWKGQAKQTDDVLMMGIEF